MSSKLFQAVVSFGIALGGASAACLTEGVGAEDEPAGGDSMLSPDGATGDGSQTSNEGAADGAAPVDGAPSEPDAYCDAAWPTTKGNPPPARECLDPTGACADAGAPLRCATNTSAGCTEPYWGSRCIGGEWHCEQGTIPADQCP